MPSVRATTATAPIMLPVVGGEQTEYHGNAAGGIQPCDACRHALTDIVEVRSLAPDDAAQDDHGVVAVVKGHLVGTIDQLKAAGHGLHVNVLGQCTMLLEGADTAFEHRSGDVGIPVGHDDAEDHVRGIGHVTGVVVRKVLCGHASLLADTLDVLVDHVHIG